MSSTRNELLTLASFSRHLAAVQAEAEVLILSTPTSRLRNRLTDVNLHLLGAVGATQEAVRLSQERK